MITATPGIIGELAVETDGLVKTFGATRAVDGVNLAIPRGSVYGVLGPNGAGKTTTIRILATLLRPDQGSARVFGHDVVRDAAAVRKLVSLTGQFASVDADLTAEENLLLLARLLGHSGLGLTQAQGSHDANVIMRTPRDRSVFPAPALVAQVQGSEVSLADPLQQIWDLQELGGADRIEAAGRLRQWLLERPDQAHAQRQLGYRRSRLRRAQ